MTGTDAGLLPFCEEVVAPQKRIRQLQRKLDRQRRSNNPANFDAQGRARRGKSWETSARQRRTQAQLPGLLARCARQRANAHGRDINLLLARARHFHHDGVSARSLQRNYGRSIGARAPGHFMSELQRKAESAGGSSSSVNVYHLKTSQYDHSSGDFVKKNLSQRWHVFADGRGAWQELEPALRAKGLFRCGSEATGARIALRAPLVKPSSTKLRGLPLAGPTARGGARARTVPAASVWTPVRKHRGAPRRVVGTLPVHGEEDVRGAPSPVKPPALGVGHEHRAPEVERNGLLPAMASRLGHIEGQPWGRQEALA